MTEQGTKGTLMGTIATTGTVSPQTINQITDKINETAQKTVDVIKGRTPALVQSGVRSVNNFRKTRLGRKMMEGVALAALLSGYVTTGMGHVIQTADRMTPSFLQTAQNAWVHGLFKGGEMVSDSVYTLGKTVYEHSPIKETVNEITPDVIQLANGVKEAIPSEIKEPTSRIGKRLASFAHQEAAKLIPESMTKGAMPVEALKRFKESAGR